MMITYLYVELKFYVCCESVNVADQLRIVNENFFSCVLYGSTLWLKPITPLLAVKSCLQGSELVESWAVLLAIARVSLCVALPVAFPNPTSIVNVENFNRCGRKGNDEGAWVDWWWGGQLSLGAGNIRHFLPPR